MDLYPPLGLQEDVGVPAPEPSGECNFVQQTRHHFSGTSAPISHSSSLGISSSTSAIVIDSDSDSSTFTAPSDAEWNVSNARVSKLAKTEAFGKHRIKWTELKRRFNSAKHEADKAKHALKKRPLPQDGESPSVVSTNGV